MKFDDILSVNEQVASVMNNKFVAPEDRLYRFMTQTYDFL